MIAIWPTESLHEPTRSKQVGRITKLIKHKVKVRAESSIKQEYHLFCVIDWYVQHTRNDWYESSAIACNNFTYSESECSYMPIQRILNRCAFGKIDVIIPPRQSFRKHGNNNNYLPTGLPIRAIFKIFHYGFLLLTLGFSRNIVLFGFDVNLLLEFLHFVLLVL